MPHIPSGQELAASPAGEPRASENLAATTRRERAVGSTSGSRAASPTPSEATARSCFICLETSNETPGEVWVTPCPCTLEAHERCMLQWIAETESAGGRKKLRCPACNGRIRTIEPWDPIVELGERYDRFWRGSAPLVLVSMFTTMGIAGSGYYGFQSMLFFAGLPNTMNWLGVRRAVTSVRQVPLWRWKHGMLLVWKLFLLNLIAPCLLLYKALPSLMNLVALPASLLYGASLISRNALPTWPPSPEWTLALMPYANVAYSSLYYDLFGSLEKKLNQALRGRSGADEDHVGAQQPANQDAADPRARNQQREGIVATLRRLRNTIANILRHDEDIVIENVGAAAAFGDGRDMEFQLEIVVAGGNDDEQNEQMLPEEGHGIDRPEQADNEIGAQPPPVPRARADVIAQDNNNNNNNNNGPAGIGGAGHNGNEMVADGNRAVTVFSDILTAMATQLMLPRISSVAGDILGILLPLSWVTKSSYRKHTGLLQEKWGRSLVGGCLFIVLRDAWNLYTKYRRVQLLRQRKIKNVDRRNRTAGA